MKNGNRWDIKCTKFWIALWELLKNEMHKILKFYFWKKNVQNFWNCVLRTVEKREVQNFEFCALEPLKKVKCSKFWNCVLRAVKKRNVQHFEIAFWEPLKNEMFKFLKIGRAHVWTPVT